MNDLANQKKLIETESPLELSKRLDVHFNDIMKLTRVLTHRSYINEHREAIEDNERLEFLGDAVLDFMVGAWLYHRYPEMREGELTQLRAAFVHTYQLAEFASRIELGNALRLGKGELVGGGRQRSALLCDAFEALVGAIFLDSGIESVQRFITPLLEEVSEQILLNHKAQDSKSALQEWVQGKGFPAPQYFVRKCSGPEHNRIFEVDVMVDGEVRGSGSGHSKQEAEKAAAHAALALLGV